MSKLTIKMVYNPNVSKYSQVTCPNFSSNSQLQIVKTKNQPTPDQIPSSTDNVAFWQEDHEDLSIFTFLIGIMPFIMGTVLFIWSLLLPEISAYREIFILLMAAGWAIINPKLGSKQNDKTSLGN